MDVFRDTRSRPYHLGQIFSMPQDAGGELAIAVPYTTATYVLSAYTFLVLLVFGAFWRIYVNLAMRFYPACSNLRGNRYIAIAGIASAGSEWGAGYLMVQYCWTMLFKARDTRSGVLALLVLVGVLLLGASRVVAGIFVPSSLIIGHVAPVDAGFIFFPPSLNLENADHDMVFFRVITQNSAQLASSYLANVQETLLDPGPRGRVSVNFTDLAPTKWGRSIAMDYRYKVTGVDLGLQLASGLSKTVEGSCRTLYDFFADDWFTISGFRVETEGRPPADLTPITPFRYVGEEFNYFIDLNATGIISVAESNDPWYATGEGIGEGSNRTFPVLPRRPVLYCRQNNTWTYGAHKVTGNTSIAELPGLKLKPVLRDYLENGLNKISPIVLLPLLLGDRMLLASSTAVENVFDASSYSIQDEMTRLVALSFVLEGDILRRTITNNPFRTKYANPALVNGTKAYGVDDFVVRSSDVATLSLKTLVAVPAVLLCALFIVWILENSIFADGNRGSGARYHVRRTAFNPMQMYRHIDEATGGIHVWKGRTSDVPYVTSGSVGEPTDTVVPGEDKLWTGTAVGGESQRAGESSFVTPKVVDRQARTPGADIEFTRSWNPELSVSWKDVGASGR